MIVAFTYFPSATPAHLLEINKGNLAIKCVDSKNYFTLYYTFYVA